MLSQNRLYNILVAAAKNSIITDEEYNKDTYILILKTHILHDSSRYDLKDPEDILTVLDAVDRFVIALRKININSGDTERIITLLKSHFHRKSISYRESVIRSLEEALFTNISSEKDKILLMLYDTVASDKEYDEMCRSFVDQLVIERYKNKP